MKTTIMTGVLVWFLACGCGGEGASTRAVSGLDLTGGMEEDGLFADSVEAQPLPEVPGPEGDDTVGVEEYVEVKPEPPADSETPDSFSAPQDTEQTGKVGDPCEAASDCADGYCVPGSEGRYCTRTCTTICPVGFECLSAPDSGPDEYDLCLRPGPRPWCRPCFEDADCEASDIGQNLRCENLGLWEGSFCTAGCKKNSNCPDGFVCNKNRCLPALGTCSCLESADNQGTETSCALTSTAGTCKGFRRCEDAGMSDCDAPVPWFETCDGLDNDCDGRVDEELPSKPCERNNQWGTCSGGATCAEARYVCDAREPGQESCNLADDDCDGAIDEEGATGCIPQWSDADGDSYGSGVQSCHCSLLPGKAARAGDCDDSTQEVAPGRSEFCDGRDNDCDGLTDENCDQDGDGYCNVIPLKWGAALTCKSPMPDCNDADPFVNPGAEELCDLLDNNCSGAVDEQCDLDNDGVCKGSKPKSPCSPAQPSYAVCVKDFELRLLSVCRLGYGDCDDTDARVSPLLREACDGLDNDCDKKIDEELDLDTDGFCEGSFSGQGGACCPLGYGDCNDLVAAIHPGAADLPDEAAEDRNCDGLDGDLADAVFVSRAAGKETNPGTMDKPKLSVLSGINQAAGEGKHQVIIDAGSYEETLKLANGVSLFGGFAAKSGVWKKEPSAKPVITGAASGAKASGIAAQTILQDLELRSGDASGSAMSSVALHVTSSTGLTLVRVTVLAGKGAAGANGVGGESGKPGANGVSGADGCDSSSCIGGTDCKTALPVGGGEKYGLVPPGTRCGGMGQAHHGLDTPEGSGLAYPWDPDESGQNSCQFRKYGPGKGGRGGFEGDSFHKDGWSGDSGAAGSDGVAGVAAGFGVLGLAGFSAQSGGNGGDGEDGTGGGGGGKGRRKDEGWLYCDSIGGEGGGGGEGGTAGRSGSGAASGGSSIGVLAFRSSIAVQACTIKTSDGGLGGAGGAGGTGGHGGYGGLGGGGWDGSGAGGNGGYGGRGGHGGAGAGGRGGHSIGLLHTCNDGTITLTNNTYVLGKPGWGGKGGVSFGNSGPGGGTGTQISVKCLAAGN